jgi:hypothetical protein
MEPRWRDDWGSVYGGTGRYLGGVGQFDLWRISSDSELERPELRVVWGSTVRNWNHLIVKRGRAELKLYYKEDGDPTTEELVLIHRYLALFLPELKLVLKGETNET